MLLRFRFSLLPLFAVLIGLVNSYVKVPTIKLANGREMPLVGLGTSGLRGDMAESLLREAFKNGYRMLDCAFLYGNQEFIGGAIKKLIGEGAIQRKDLFVIGKVWNDFHTEQRAKAHIMETLKVLQMDYFDLLLIHWPMAFDSNDARSHIPPDHQETWRALEWAVKNGMAKSIGLANFNHKQIDHVLAGAKIKPVVLEAEFNPYYQQKKMRDYLKRHGIALIGYSPLANPGNPATNRTMNVLRDPVITKIAHAKHKTNAQVTLRYAVQNNVAVIPKSSSPKRLMENIDLFNFALTPAEMAEMGRIDRNKKSVLLEHLAGHPQYPFHEEY